MIQILVTLILIGLLLYLVSLVPIDGTIKKIINAIVIVLVIVWIIGLFYPPMRSTLPILYR